MFALIKSILRRILLVDRRRAMAFYKGDCKRFLSYSGERHVTYGTLQAKIIMHYHVIEKGLTMPNRHLAFGKSVVISLMELIHEFMKHFKCDNAQINHAIGVLKEYYELHKANDYDFSSDPSYWQSLSSFLDKYPAIKSSHQKHMTFDEFYGANEAPFPAFARSRHSVRNYAKKELAITRLQSAVTLALTAPSACNRQYCKVHCISDDRKMELMEIQGGNRGFGHLADKVLVITSSLEGIISPKERNDIFVNGGMFLMNLCYALHYYKIAHCILNWSQSLENDALARKIIGPSIKNDEMIIALLSCGEAPDEFDIAESPRKLLEEVFVYE